MRICHVQLWTDQNVIGVFYTRHTGNTFLWNASKFLPEYTGSRPTKQPLFTVTAAETSDLTDLLESISINVLSPILRHWLLGLCLDSPAQRLHQYTQEGVTPSYAVLHTFLKLPSLAVFYTRPDDHFICLSESHCGSATATDGPQALSSSGAPLYVGFACFAVVVCIPQPKSVEFGELPLLRRVRVNIHRLPIEPPTHYLNPYPLVHHPPPTNPTNRVSNYPST